jgi:two-component system, sensor histidine kinase ChiS
MELLTIMCNTYFEMKNTIHSYLIICLFLTIITISSCKDTTCYKTTDSVERSFVDSIVKANLEINSLVSLKDSFRIKNEIYGEMICSKELGRLYRESSNFQEAISSHEKALELSLLIRDTTQVIQMLNQLGTDYRRIGICDKAADYHYDALNMCEKYSDTTSFQSKKNKLIALNGIGNLQLTLNNYKAAEEAFRSALKGEIELKSELGQAINYANIGAIFECEGLLDSARTYYTLSLRHNQLAKSDLGISLCYNHFGALSEKEGNFSDALKEYKTSYELMVNHKDRWHWLESCLSLSRVNLRINNLSQAKIYIDKAFDVIKDLNSLEYLVTIYSLKSSYFKKLGNFEQAFQCYEKSVMYGDSIGKSKTLNEMQNLRVNYERERNSKELLFVTEAYKSEQRTKIIFLVLSILIVLSSIITIFFLIYSLRIRAKNQRIMKDNEQIKQNFFTNITHEFRTPLTIILGLSKQIEDELNENDCNTSIKELVTIISRQGNNLLDLINQLLDVSKVSSNIGIANWRRGDLVAMSRMIVENMQLYANEFFVDIRIKSEATTIDMDFVPDFMIKIFRNIIFNAIKYSPRGESIDITISEQLENVIIIISDRGRGIKKDDLNNLFEPFYQCGESDSKLGSGIGLSLVKQMIEAMNGKIDVISEIGKGTSFTITMPKRSGKDILERWNNNISLVPVRIKLNPDSYAHILEDNEDLDGEKSSILVAEDNQEISIYIEKILGNKYNLIFARNGKEALSKAIEFIPDIIITDLMMPEMDGTELCTKIRSEGSTNHIPIIIITAISDDETKLSNIEKGADAYLVKPFNPDELKVLINNLLERNKLLREKYSRALETNGIDDADLPDSNKEFLLRLNKIMYKNMSDVNFNYISLAEAVFLSPRQLGRKLKSLTGLSTNAFIQSSRIIYAKELLKITKIPIADIAIKCGFEYQSYFNRMFKQYTGFTPNQYRNDISE